MSQNDVDEPLAISVYSVSENDSDNDLILYESESESGPCVYVCTSCAAAAPIKGYVLSPAKWRALVDLNKHPKVGKTTGHWSTKYTDFVTY